MIYYGIGHPEGFPWIAASLTGALLAATDPVAILDIMRKAGVSERLCLLLDGEALFNDAIAIVTFSIFLYIAQHPMENISIFNASIRFLIIFFGGAITGLLMGVTVGMFTDNWLAMLIVIARAVGIFGGALLISLLPGVEKIPLKHQSLMFVGGLRGAVTLVLALALPIELEYWWTVQSIAFGVVLFTLFVQAPAIIPILRRKRFKDD